MSRLFLSRNLERESGRAGRRRRRWWVSGDGGCTRPLPPPSLEAAVAVASQRERREGARYDLALLLAQRGKQREVRAVPHDCTARDKWGRGNMKTQGNLSQFLS
eukprot:COSAG01_NODE_4653_length_4846_cov_2.561197_5_plen_104_part_00